MYEKRPAPGRRVNLSPSLAVPCRKLTSQPLWLELLTEECGIASSLTAELHSESFELIAIFTTMINRTHEKH
jgi:hypothetical protein